MKTRQFTLIAGAIGILTIIAFLIFSNSSQKPPETNIPPVQKPSETNILPVQTKTPVTDFSGCVAAGNPTIESSPRQCKSDEIVFTEDIGNTLDKTNLIRLTSPRPGEVIRSPLTIRGEARGNWFFEASFPVELTDGKGRTITGTIATAQSDWMTKEFVPFEAVLKFDSNQILDSTGILVLKRDNPSGLPENEDALKIPVSIGGTKSEPGSNVLKTPSYKDIIGFIDQNITDIIGAYSSKKATNNKWFADGFGFTSASHVYVDFEDGHFLFRALLECSYQNSVITCTPLAILEKQKGGGWIATEGADTQKDSPIIHTWAKDYEWKR